METVGLYGGCGTPQTVELYGDYGTLWRLGLGILWDYEDYDTLIDCETL